MSKQYVQRKTKLIKSLKPNAIVVLSAFNTTQQSRDGAAPFLQEANFFWLTGISEPGWCCLVSADLFYLISPERSDSQELFEGRLSDKEALSISGADKVISEVEFKDILAKFSSNNSPVYTLGPDPQAEYYDFELNTAPLNLYAELCGIFETVKDCRPYLSRLRAIKTEEEIEGIRQAIKITEVAFARAKEELHTARYEYEVEAAMTYEIRKQGATGHAYEPIVASGSNALTLHYSKNNSELPASGLVLLDVGARADGYAADITRTYAIGEPSEREKSVHAAVEKAHKAIIALIAPGVSLKNYQNDSDSIMKEALESLGLLDEPTDYRKYFPHAISHGLGLDVHESLGGYESFQPGMVLTVEPGIYIPEEGIGVRIEDDILVTSSGNENLSTSLPTGL